MLTDWQQDIYQNISKSQMQSQQTTHLTIKPNFSSSCFLCFSEYDTRVSFLHPRFTGILLIAGTLNFIAYIAEN